MAAIPDRVDYWLTQWAAWHRHDQPRLGYPSRSAVLVSGGESRRGDEWEEDETRKFWGRNCQIMEALINGLPQGQRTAVNAFYLTVGVEVPNAEQIVATASESLLIGMNARGVI